MKTHELKVWPEFFPSILDGTKPFEVRRNDRDYEVGDLLILSEWSKEQGFTGRSVSKTVTYMMVGGTFGIDPEHCVMGLVDLPILELPMLGKQRV